MLAVFCGYFVARMFHRRRPSPLPPPGGAFYVRHDGRPLR